MMENWEVIIDVKIGGGGKEGADGVAFWYVEEPGVLGSAFGAKEQWKGLGVFIDTYDNDGHSDNPSVYAWINDGTFAFENSRDGTDYQVGGCVLKELWHRDPYITARVKVVYQEGRLQVLVDNEEKKPENRRFVPCVEGVDVQLPRGYYLMLSAATGDFFGKLVVVYNLITSRYTRCY
jgi:mannose-binding lectin 1